MDPRPVSAAEATSITVIDAARTGASLRIPGALEVGRDTGRVPAPEPGAPWRRAGAASDVDRSEFARDGGGSPEERPVGPRKHWLERVRRLLLTRLRRGR